MTLIRDKSVLAQRNWIFRRRRFTKGIFLFMYVIGLYRDVWIAAIASSRTRLATLTGAMCKTSQCELRSIRVNSGMLNVIVGSVM